MDEENLTSKQRALMYIDYKGISVRKFCKITGLSHSVFGSGKNFGTDKAALIIDMFPDLNPEWLLTGKGEMLRAVGKEDRNPINAQKDLKGPHVYTSYQKVPIPNSRRIGFFLEKKNISVRVLEKLIGASNGAIGRAINNGTDIHSIWISRIIETYPNLNPEWLLTGKGEMLREVKGVEPGGGQVLEVIQPDQSTGMSIQSKESIAYVTGSKEKDFIIDGLKNQLIEQKHSHEQIMEEKEGIIGVLRTQIEEQKSKSDQIVAAKDKQIGFLECQIGDLKNNMERLISEKSEVVKMKDEMLLMKDRMLEIQTDKIAELEGLNKRQTKEAGKQKSA